MDLSSPNDIFIIIIVVKTILHTTNIVAPIKIALVSKVILSGNSILNVSVSVNASEKNPRHCLEISPTLVPDESSI